MLQKEFSLFVDFSSGFAICVIVPDINAVYRYIKIFETLEVIDTVDNSKVAVYNDYDFKLFIKVMKKILRCNHSIQDMRN